MEYKVDANENGGLDTLHGGSNGWDWVSLLPLFKCSRANRPQRNFTVESHTENSITFSLLDPDGEQGFPGAVQSYITYTLTPYAWHLKMYATALTKKTPIMLSSHVSSPRPGRTNFVASKI